MAYETAPEAGYVLGHSQRELARLEKQAGFFSESTRDGLLRAGVAPRSSVELGEATE